jgi:hypothetical protein
LLLSQAFAEGFDLAPGPNPTFVSIYSSIPPKNSEAVKTILTLVRRRFNLGT